MTIIPLPLVLHAISIGLSGPLIVLRGHTSSSALYAELRALTCGSRVQEYVY